MVRFGCTTANDGSAYNTSAPVFNVMLLRGLIWAIISVARLATTSL